MHISFTIPGKAVAKERPRRGRYGNFYTPKKTQDYEALVHLYALKVGLKPFPKDEIIGIGICFYGNYNRQDLSNLLKSIEDGLRHFCNDNKVTFLVAKKIPSKEYLTKVRIWA